MDPLSITTGCIAIATLVAQTGKAIADLRTLIKELPQRLCAVRNEVNDIGLVVSQVQEFAERRKHFQLLVSDAVDANVVDLLKKATINLGKLHIIVSELAVSCSKEGNKVAFFRARAWKQKHPEIELVQKEVVSIKSSLLIILQASNACDAMDMRIDVQNLTSITSSITEDQDRFRGDLLTSLSIIPSYTSNILEEKLGGMLRRHSEELEMKTVELFNDQDSRLDPLIRRPPRPRRPVRPRNSKPRQDKGEGDGVAIQVAQYASNCQKTCTCSCHMQTKAPAPAFLNRVLGQLFVGSAGLPLLSQKCNSQSCKSAKSPKVSVEYWFPIGIFWSQIVQLQVGYHATMGPQFSLKSLRRVPDSAQCVHYAMDGNIEGLKVLFSRGLASPWDVSSTRGYTLSRWALYSKQYKAAKFLTMAGSDPDYRPIAKTDNSTRNKAFDNLFQGGLDKEAEEDIRCLTASSDWIEQQNFSRLHKIVVGLLPQDLEKAILDDIDQIDVTDAMGRTPLLWAAARGDEKFIRILLDYNADPNIMDMYIAPPVSYAADRGHTLCVKLLLEAGALAEPILPPGVKLGSPLNCAARNTKDPTLLKYLLTYGALVDGTGVDGNTALIHAARKDNIRFAVLLLDYNADINATSITQHTPLTTAITYNSHRVLELLLDRWDEFSTCPRLQGPHLLEITALYGDVETVRLLTKTDHLQLRYDENYSLREFAKRLTERADVTDELIQGFDELLLVLEDDPYPERPSSRESSVEEDLPPDYPSALAAMYMSEKITADARHEKKGSLFNYSGDSDDSSEFEDALEDLEGLDSGEKGTDEKLPISCPAGFS